MPRSEHHGRSAPAGVAFFGDEPRQFRASVTAIAELGALDAAPDEIPGAKPCYACGGPTMKSVVDYSYTYDCNDITAITATKTLPGYKCEQCGEVYLDPALDDRFLGVVAQVLAGLASPALQNELDHRSDDPHSFTIFSPMPTPSDE